MATLHTYDSPETALDATRSGVRLEADERELLLLVAVSFAVMWGTIFLLHRSAALVFQYGDNGAYLDVAKTILHWDFRNLHVQHFMGYPYAIATASLLFHISPALALWLIAVISSFFSVWLTARLFGMVVAQYFAFTNFAWIQLSFIGGSEPLAMALGLGAMLAFRRNRVVLSALLASLSVIVRPLMIFALVGIGVYRKQWTALLAALGIGLGIGVLYVLPLAHYAGDPFLTVHTYTTRDYGAAKVVGPHGHLFGWPFHGIVAGTIAYPAPWTNLVLSFFWIALVLVGIAMMFSRRFRSYANEHVAEVIFCGLYLLAVFSYDYLIWARSNFFRFVIPALPFVFFALLPFLPKRRWFLCCLCVLGSVLAALSAIGWRNVIPLH
jgi:hypothetical protein